MGNLVSVDYAVGDVIRVIQRLDHLKDSVPDGYQVHFMPLGVEAPVVEVIPTCREVVVKFEPDVLGVDGTYWDEHYFSYCDVELVARGQPNQRSSPTRPPEAT